MNAFVTGSTGLLGNNLVHLLVKQGYQVKGLVRSKEKASNLLSDIDMKIVEGDMSDISGFASELNGCDLLFHTAAYFREYYQKPAKHWQLFKKINIEGTIKLFSEAEKSGIRKAVYVSTAGVIGRRSSGAPGDESTSPPPLAYRNLYLKSKFLAKEATKAFLEKHSLPVVLILPGWMFGPGDAAPTSSGQLVIDFLRQRLPGIIDGGMCVVDARDVAQAMINAVEWGKSGERYIIGGHYFSIEDIMKILEKITGISSPRFHLPHTITMIYAWFSEVYARLTSKQILVSLEGIWVLHEKSQWNSDKAIHELGITFRPLEETLRDEISWYRSHNYL
jgi:dihydroflavonol-4-reductase